MAQRRRRARLALEARDERRLFGALAREHLDRHGAIEHAIGGAIDDSHSPAPEHIEQLIAPQEHLLYARHHRILPLFGASHPAGRGCTRRCITCPLTCITCITTV